eukprot:575009-Prorocentrum_minimum.AAC.1
MLRCVASFEGTRVSGSRFCSLTWKYSLHCAGCDSAAARAGGASSSVSSAIIGLAPSPSAPSSPSLLSPSLPSAAGSAAAAAAAAAAFAASAAAEAASVVSRSSTHSRTCFSGQCTSVSIRNCWQCGASRKVVSSVRDRSRHPTRSRMDSLHSCTSSGSSRPAGTCTGPSPRSDPRLPKRPPTPAPPLALPRPGPLVPTPAWHGSGHAAGGRPPSWRPSQGGLGGRLRAPSRPLAHGGCSSCEWWQARRPVAVCHANHCRMSAAFCSSAVVVVPPGRCCTCVRVPCPNRTATDDESEVRIRMRSERVGCALNVLDEIKEEEMHLRLINLRTRVCPRRSSCFDLSGRARKHTESGAHRRDRLRSLRARLRPDRRLLVYVHAVGHGSLRPPPAVLLLALPLPLPRRAPGTTPASPPQTPLPPPETASGALACYPCSRLVGKPPARQTQKRREPTRQLVPVDSVSLRVQQTQHRERGTRDRHELTSTRAVDEHQKRTVRHRLVVSARVRLQRSSPTWQGSWTVYVPMPPSRGVLDGPFVEWIRLPGSDYGLADIKIGGRRPTWACGSRAGAAAYVPYVFARV